MNEEEKSHKVLCLYFLLKRSRKQVNGRILSHFGIVNTICLFAINLYRIHAQTKQEYVTENFKLETTPIATCASTFK